MTQHHGSNARLMCVTWGNVGSEKLGDWPSVVLVLDKGVWVHTLAFTPKLKWDYCIFSCILGLLQVHIFVMYISNYKCIPTITSSSPQLQSTTLNHHSSLCPWGCTTVGLSSPSPSPLLSLSNCVWGLWSCTQVKWWWTLFWHTL